MGIDFVAGRKRVPKPATGKTTYVTNLIKQFADRYVKDNDFYLPILVQLKNFTKFWNLEDLIKNYNILYGLSINDFENKFRQGKILFVFDGYDELPKGTVEKFNEVNSLVSARNKVIITSRTHYFENKEDEELSLDPESMDFTGISLKDKPEEALRSMKQDTIESSHNVKN